MLTDEQWQQIEKDCMIPTPKGWSRSVANRAYALGFAAGIERAAIEIDDAAIPDSSWIAMVIRALKP